LPPAAPPRAPAAAKPSAQAKVGPGVSAAAAELHLRRAATWKRAAAWLADGLLLGLFGGAILWLVGRLAGTGAAGPPEASLDWLVAAAERNQRVLFPALVFVALSAAVYAALGHALMGATLGKRLFGLRVVGRDGRRPSVARSAARAGLSLFSFLFLGLGALLALFTRSGRALHDFLAGTYVVEGPAPS
jgi:uncharacterized RDD family membrane protein YckC